MSTLLVGLGGVLGALARHAVGARVETGTVDTLAVNVLGSLALGALLAVPLADATLALLATGFCGAFTTFSTFAFETVRLFETGDRREAVGNAVVTLVGSLLAVGAGAWLGGALA